MKSLAANAFPILYLFRGSRMISLALCYYPSFFFPFSFTGYTAVWFWLIGQSTGSLYSTGITESSSPFDSSVQATRGAGNEGTLPCRFFDLWDRLVVAPRRKHNSVRLSWTRGHPNWDRVGRKSFLPLIPYPPIRHLLASSIPIDWVSVFFFFFSFFFSFFFATS